MHYILLLFKSMHHEHEIYQVLQEICQNSVKGCLKENFVIIFLKGEIVKADKTEIITGNRYFAFLIALLAFWLNTECNV